MAPRAFDTTKAGRAVFPERLRRPPSRGNRGDEPLNSEEIAGSLKFRDQGLENREEAA